MGPVNPWRCRGRGDPGTFPRLGCIDHAIRPGPIRPEKRREMKTDEPMLPIEPNIMLGLKHTPEKMKKIDILQLYDIEP